MTLLKGDQMIHPRGGGNMSKQFQNGKNTPTQNDKINQFLSKDSFVEVVDCAALNIREYPNGPVVDVAQNGAKLKMSSNKSTTIGWTCVISPTTHKDAYAMSHFLKEV